MKIWLFFIFTGVFLDLSWANEAYKTEIKINLDIKPEGIKKPNVHFPVLGDKATTVKPWHLNFDKMPGGQSTDSIVMNSLSLGVGSRVELGVIPWVYTTGNEAFMRYGVTAKYNFYKGQEFQWAVGGSQIKGEMKESTKELDEKGYGPDYQVKMNQFWNYLFSSVNYTPHGSRYNFGITLKYTEIKSKSLVRGVYNTEIYDKKVPYPVSSSNTDTTYQTTTTFDMNYQLRSHHWVGAAFGTASLTTKLNTDSVGDDEMNEEARVRYVIGTSYIHKRKLGIIEDPRLSLIVFEGDGAQFGFSTTF